MSAVQSSSSQGPLRPTNRDKDSVPKRSIKVQEPQIVRQDSTSNGKEGKDKASKVLQLSSFEVRPGDYNES